MWIVYKFLLRQHFMTSPKPPRKDLTVQQAIDEAGGPTKVSRACGVHMTSVQNWRKETSEGVDDKYWASFAQCAKYSFEPTDLYWANVNHRSQNSSWEPGAHNVSDEERELFR